MLNSIYFYFCHQFNATCFLGYSYTFLYKNSLKWSSINILFSGGSNTTVFGFMASIGIISLMTGVLGVVMIGHNSSYVFGFVSFVFVFVVMYWNTKLS